MSKKIIIPIVIISLLAVVLVVLNPKRLIIDKEEIPISVRVNESKPTIEYGINEAYIKETTPMYNRISLNINSDNYEEYGSELDQDITSCKEVELIFKIDNLTHIQIQSIVEKIQSINSLDIVYVYLEGEEKGERQAIYTKLEELNLDKIKLVYPIEEYGTEVNPEYIGIDIKNEEDLQELKDFITKLNGNNDTMTEVMVYDSIVTYNKDDLKKTLDLIQLLYYDSILSYPQVNSITQQSNLGTADVRVSELYESFIEDGWLTRTGNIYEINPYNKVDVDKLLSVGSYIDIVVPYEGDVEYVEYKLNDSSIYTEYRYPYGLQYNLEDIKNNYNELRIIVKERDKEKPIAQNIYFKSNIEIEDNAEEQKIRAQRADISYELNQKMIYEYPHIPVLMYHEFAEEVEKSSAAQSITVGTDLFEEQIKRLLEEGYTAITFKDLQLYFEGNGGLPEKPIIITTDDGYLSNYEIAYPILKKYNIQATFFVTSKYVGVDTQSAHFTWDDAREMEESGLIDIQSHTHSHAQMNTLSEAGVIYQVKRSFEDIENNLGRRDVNVVSYPQFLHSDDTIEWLSSEDVDIQITDLVKNKAETIALDVKRIHVSNETTPDELIKEIERVTN